MQHITGYDKKHPQVVEKPKTAGKRNLSRAPYQETYVLEKFPANGISDEFRIKKLMS